MICSHIDSILSTEYSHFLTGLRLLLWELRLPPLLLPTGLLPLLLLLLLDTILMLTLRDTLLVYDLFLLGSGDLDLVLDLDLESLGLLLRP